MWYRLRRRLSCVVLSLSLCLSLSFVPATASASKTPEMPETYQVTAAELQQLESNLAMQKTINSELRQVSGKQKNQIIDLQTALTQAQERLKEAQRQQTALQMQIQTLTTLSQNQNATLNQVNASFDAFEKEQKRTRLRIKAQRNVWETAAGLLLVGLAMK